MRSFRRIVLLGAVAAAAIAPAHAAAATVRAPEGAVSGEVRIQRDEYGVPYVFAETTYGIFYGFGYALAEDQLYQMEILKRTAEGRVAEVLGSRFLAKDRSARSRVDRSSLAAQYAALSPDDKDIFRGLADGLNARIRLVVARQDELLAKDFRDSGFMPEAWGPLDVIAVYEHSMAVRFSDLNNELDNLALLTRLRETRAPAAAWKLFQHLRWISDDDAPTTIAAVDQHTLPIPTFGSPDTAMPAGQLPNGLKALPDAVLYGPAGTDVARIEPDRFPHASNAWLAAPARTTNGETVLVNGPQMGDYASAYIWAIGLHGAGFNLIGSGPAGSPFLIFGTNGEIGWGGTAGLGDTVDIYQERLDPDDPHRYLFKGHSLAMARRDETIQIKGAPATTMTVYSTVHGVVDLFDQANGVAYSRKRSWAGSEVTSLVSWVHAMKAHDYPQWRANVSQVTIAINNYFLDKSGNIAYQFLGSFPIRPATQDFRLPVVGDGSMEWSGFHSPTTNPYVFHPRDGIIANWNNKPRPGYHNSDFMYWSRVDRVNEITEQLVKKSKFSPSDLWNVIQDTSYTDVTARYFQQLVLNHRTDWRKDSSAGNAARILADWNLKTDDPTTARAEPGYILYRAFLSRLLKTLYAPVIPDRGPAREQAEKDFLQFDPIFPSMGVKIAYVALSPGQDNSLLDGRRPADLLAQALEQGLDDVTAELGPDPAGWIRPSAPHIFSTDNYAGIPQTTDRVPITLPIHMNRGTENDRIIFDHGEVSYCDVIPPGESGFIAPDGRRSPHHDDQLALYRDFTCKQGWIKPADIDRHTVSTEHLAY